MPCPCPQPVFPEHRQIDVVLQDDVDPQRFLESGSHIHRVEIGNVRRQQDAAGPGVRCARRADHGHADAFARDVQMACGLAAEISDLIDDKLAATPVGRHDFLGKHLAGEIGNGEPDLGAAEINRRDIGRIRHQFIGHGRASNMAAGAPRLAHPVVQLQLPHDLRNRLLGKPRLLGNRRARDRPILDDGLHHGPLGKLPGDTQGFAHGHLN